MHRDKLNPLITRKKSHIRNYFQENYTNARNSWKETNELIKEIKKAFDKIYLDIGGSLFFDETVVANEF